MIESNLVRIEPIRLEHALPLSKWVNDPDMWQWWLREPPTTIDKLERSIREAFKERDSGLREPFAVFSKELQTYVGETSFWFDSEDEVEIGSTWLCAELRGTGFNRAVKHLMITHASRVYGSCELVLQTDELNLRSQRAIEAIGGVEFKRMKADKITWDGRVRTSVFYRAKRA